MVGVCRPHFGNADWYSYLTLLVISLPAAISHFPNSPIFLHKQPHFALRVPTTTTPNTYGHLNAVPSPRHLPRYYHRRAIMDTGVDEVQTTLSLIEGAGLPHPSAPLLASFVTEALNPPSAARYMKRRLLLGEGSSLVTDWSYIVESSKTFRCFSFSSPT